MSDSQKPPREFWLCLRCNYFYLSKRSTCSTSDCYSLELVQVIERKAYDQLMQQSLAMREALEEIYNDTKADHGIHESEIKSWDSSSLGNVKGALEQFDEFMKSKDSK